MDIKEKGEGTRCKAQGGNVQNPKSKNQEDTKSKNQIPKSRLQFIESK
jgi:hypothetical protein